MTVLQDYTNWIVEFSKQYPIAEENKLNVYIAGIGEELLEYQDICDSYGSYEQRLKELGDVLAYVCLAANKLDIRLATLEDYKLSYSDSLTLSIALLTLGTLKRYFRGDNDISERQARIVNDSYFYLLSELEGYDNTKLEDVINLNKQKLTQRSVNKTLVGTGDNR